MSLHVTNLFKLSQATDEAVYLQLTYPNPRFARFQGRSLCGQSLYCLGVVSVKTWRNGRSLQTLPGIGGTRLLVQMSRQPTVVISVVFVSQCKKVIKKEQIIYVWRIAR